MKYHVNESCIGCGLCEGTCPEVFSLNNEGKAVAKDIDTDDPQAMQALEGCPVGAIEEVK
ncbi:MAG: ferredoxin [Sphaerochaetaceae bacterium]|jgi:ferredoxin